MDKKVYRSLLIKLPGETILLIKTAVKAREWRETVTDPCQVLACAPVLSRSPRTFLCNKTGKAPP